MTVRHLVARANVDAGGIVLDPRRVRHGALRAGHIYALAGEVDPCTHLNLDFPDHRLEGCVVVERLEAGAAAVAAPAGFVVARVALAAWSRLGPVDVGARRAAWLAATRARRQDREGREGRESGHHDPS